MKKIDFYNKYKMKPQLLDETTKVVFFNEDESLGYYKIAYKPFEILELEQNAIAGLMLLELEINNKIPYYLKSKEKINSLVFSNMEKITLLVLDSRENESYSNFSFTIMINDIKDFYTAKQQEESVFAIVDKYIQEIINI